MFLAVYFTPFVPVVTLGGTVLGAAVTGLAAALIGLLVRRVQPHQRLTRAAIELVGITLVVTDTARYLPGWRITQPRADGPGGSPVPDACQRHDKIRQIR